jgi:hypothetical protein
MGNGARGLVPTGLCGGGCGSRGTRGWRGSAAVPGTARAGSAVIFGDGAHDGLCRAQCRLVRWRVRIFGAVVVGLGVGDGATARSRRDRLGSGWGRATGMARSWSGSGLVDTWGRGWWWRGQAGGSTGIARGSAGMEGVFL